MAERKKDYKQKDYSAEYGKLPPQALDLEEAVLSALLLESDAYSMVGDMLEVETFYKKSHKIIFNAILLYSCINRISRCSCNIRNY